MRARGVSADKLHAMLNDAKCIRDAKRTDYTVNNDERGAQT